MQQDRRLLLARLEDTLANFEKKFYRQLRPDERQEFEEVIRFLREFLDSEASDLPREKAAD